MKHLDVCIVHDFDTVQSLQQARSIGASDGLTKPSCMYALSESAIPFVF